MKNPTTDTQENVCTLLDSGSERIYVSKKLAKQLNLNLGEMNELNLSCHFLTKAPKESKVTIHSFGH